MKKRVIVTTLILAVAAAAWWFLRGGVEDDYTYRTEPISRGEIEKVVRATGTINPLQTVKVGSQVSGTIAKLYVDFNSTVTAGQIVAVIDSTFLSASVREAEANVQRTTAQRNEAERALNRAKELFAKDLVSQADLDAALTTYETSVAQSKQTEAALERAQVNLRYAVIRSPINGIVVSRDVDVGQTVAASLQAPQLFAIANDLSRMQVEASVDEADIGQITTGQKATFTVDAYPDENFEGEVTQVRLSPINLQNVVTYTVIIEVPNPGQKLRPGMTATASILIDKRENVLRVPAVAMRFQPPADVLEAYNRAHEADSTGGGGRGDPGRPDGARAEMRSGGDANAATPDGPRRESGQADTSRRGGGERRDRQFNRRGGSEGQAGGDERRMGGAQGQNDGQAGGGEGRPPGGGMRGMGSWRRAPAATVWVLSEDGKLTRVRVRTGITDQRYVELIGDKLKEGDKVVLGVIGGNQNNAGGQRPTSPFQPQPGGGGQRRM
jgi:HlyD family secretion protein